MTTTPKAIIGSKYAEIAETNQYTSTNVKTSIDKFTGTNVTGTAATLAVRLVPAGGTAGPGNTISFTVSIMPFRTYLFPELIGHILDPGDFISTLAGTANAIVIRSSGRQFPA